MSEHVSTNKETGVYLCECGEGKGRQRMTSCSLRHHPIQLRPKSTISADSNWVARSSLSLACRKVRKPVTSSSLCPQRFLAPYSIAPVTTSYSA